MAAAELMIQAEGLEKNYGETRALAGVSFGVPAGTILGLLGPNGAGKTTAVRILTTLATPDAGHATVAGIDVVKHPAEVRRHIGVAAQDATLDPLLTGRQNLVAGRRAVGHGAGGGPAAGFGAARGLRADVRGGPGHEGVLGRHASSSRPGGVADDPSPCPVPRRADHGAGPDVTAPRVWDAIRELIGEGVTVLLTTQYLEEADELAHQIVVVDHGRVIADGTPAGVEGGVADGAPGGDVGGAVRRGRRRDGAVGRPGPCT